MSALQDMLDAQQKLQELIPPFPNRATSDDPQTICEFIKDNAYALEDELHELTAEIGWKFWTSSWHINYDAARAEWTDIWLFLMNIANRLGMTEDMIVELYYKKRGINVNRHASEYDGISTKCPTCKRALDDPAVKCKVDGDYEFCANTQTETTPNGATP